MTLLAVTFAAIGAMIPAYIAVLFWLDPVRALAQATHRPEQLPMVMVDRYATFALFAAAAAVSGNMAVIALTFAILSVPGFADAAIYARAGKTYKKHLAAGAAAFSVSVFAMWAAQASGGL